MAISMAGFVIGDAISKVIVAEMNQGQLMLVRGLFATCLIAALAWHRGALKLPRQAAHPMVALRVVSELCATALFLLALARMPLANISAVLQALPLAVTMGAALFMGEPVGWRRWLAITAGFVGVLVIVRPGFEGFTVYSVIVLGSVFFCAVRDLATRHIPGEVPSLLVSTVTAGAVAVAGAALVGPLGGWTPMTMEQTGLLAGSAIVLVVGYQFIIMAMRVGEISFIAPFRYTALLWAILLGYVMFSETPDWPMIAGAAIVIGSGLYALYRERKVDAQRPAATSTAPTMAPDGL